MTQTPWLYETTSVTTVPVPVRWEIITYPDPDPYPDDGDPEDKADEPY